MTLKPSSCRELMNSSAHLRTKNQELRTDSRCFPLSPEAIPSATMVEALIASRGQRRGGISAGAPGHGLAFARSVARSDRRGERNQVWSAASARISKSRMGHLSQPQRE
eukprot:CAMPEP_0171572304 /NCGR_PEP_ID=MMETSP0961-20121227/4053_1 /TAXON_ID=87120 /ORGANISM="Aurantiochytrium limacinum, Strain ATCCMYA-1381" /LENGTH=108 /DNA_ID=CAMNT_0012127145 /DNA_START=2089 /DNA_END=2412 /DNA_ORIENTATION=+